MYSGALWLHSAYPGRHLSILTLTPVVRSLLLSSVPWCVPELVCPLSCGWTLNVAVFGESWQRVRNVSWPTGSVPTDWRCNISSPCRGVPYETGSLPGVEQSPGPGIWVIYTKSMAPARPDAHVATGQISPLKVHHTGT